ncbi:hypothetical protein NQ117_01100 [Paenibacillus sp. SC116]|nr:hypothetical protein [Paenibacillus sp. SC116]
MPLTPPPGFDEASSLLHGHAENVRMISDLAPVIVKLHDGNNHHMSMINEVDMSSNVFTPTKRIDFVDFAKMFTNKNKRLPHSGGSHYSTL